MRYAIIESGGKQYRAVEGQTIQVDRLSDQEGAQVDLRALLMADGDDFMIGTPTVGGIQVKATVLGHIRGEKAVRFKYSPKKRIRVRGGHRQQYTELAINFIGREGETRKVEKAEAVIPAAEGAEVEKPPKSPARKAAPRKTAAKSSATPAKSVAKSATKKSGK
jgi:large subunit ribosomal protein L21